MTNKPKTDKPKVINISPQAHRVFKSHCALANVSMYKRATFLLIEDSKKDIEARLKLIEEFGLTPKLLARMRQLAPKFEVANEFLLPYLLAMGEEK